MRHGDMVAELTGRDGDSIKVAGTLESSGPLLM
jgi:hypothetical protein